VLFAAFFRWALKQHDTLYRNVGAFFAPEQPGLAGPDLLRDYVASHPSRIREALLRIVPPQLQAELGIGDWEWLSGVLSDDGTGILDRVVAEVEDDLRLLQQLEDEAVARRQARQIGHFQRVIKTVRSRELLGFLGSRNVLPKYGFPTDVVELRTNHLPVEVANRIELQRDLRIAIAEYAPGGEVVAAKHIWTSGGLNRMPSRGWPTFNYAVCPDCGRFHRSAVAVEGSCTVCGADLRSRLRRRGEFVIPEFGFIVADAPRPSGESRPQRFHSSRVYFTEYAASEGRRPSAEPPFTAVGDLSSSGLQIQQRYSRFGKLAVVNSGRFGRGFRICESCGFGEPVPSRSTAGRRGSRSPHNDPRTRRPCTGSLSTYHLGHEFITDVLELRLSGILAALAAHETWISVLYALLEGASECLGIRRDDLDGTLYPHAARVPPALVLFDSVPGGAGHVKRIADELPGVFVTAWQRVDGCECGRETSCYECLRNFRNQVYHDQLARGLAADFLRGVLGSAGVPTQVR
jgi:hypothetical protein